MPSFSSEDTEDDTERHAVLFWIFMSRVLVRSGQALLSQLERTRYLGPIRKVPPRGYRPPLTPDESRWADGLGAWDALFRNPLVPGVRRELVEHVAHYIQNVLNLGYSLRREERIELDSDSEIMAELRLLAIHYDERDKDYFSQRILQPIEALPTHAVIQLHDEQQNVDVDPADIGVGVSQVIPVVVGAFAPSSAGSSVFAVEQPELHVHPAVQVALGDVFIDAAVGTGRTMLIETHSEHLLLRMLRRVREGGGAKPPLKSGDGYGDGEGYGTGTGDGVGDGSGYPRTVAQRAFSASDLSVVYVKPTPDGVKLTPLPVTKDGDFEEPWPEGFFDERDTELF